MPISDTEFNPNRTLNVESTDRNLFTSLSATERVQKSICAKLFVT